MAYRFQTSKVVDGVPYKAGAIVPCDEIPAGCADPMLRLGEIVEVEDARLPKKPPAGESRSGDDKAAKEPKPKK